MRHSRRTTAFWVLACALFAAILFLLLRPADVKLLNLPDKSTQFRFAEITQGTNHVIFVGNPVVARLKWLGFRQRRLRPLCQWIPASIRGDFFLARTDTIKRALWVVFENPEPLILHCSITNSVGHDVELGNLGHFASARGIGLNVHAFELPRSLGKHKAHTVRVYGVGLYEQENELATLQVR